MFYGRYIKCRKYTASQIFKVRWGIRGEIFSLPYPSYVWNFHSQSLFAPSSPLRISPPSRPPSLFRNPSRRASLQKLRWKFAFVSERTASLTSANGNSWEREKERDREGGGRAGGGGREGKRKGEGEGEGRKEGKEWKGEWERNRVIGVKERKRASPAGGSWVGSVHTSKSYLNSKVWFRLTPPLM